MKSEHSGILYPSKAAELFDAVATSSLPDDLPKLPPLNNLPAAIVTSHGSYSNILPFLRQAYSSTAKLHPKLIVLLAPLHRPVLLEDSAFAIFLAEADSWETPLGKLVIENKLENTLRRAFPDKLGKRNAYFQEESAIELQLPFCQHHFPHVPILPFLGAWEDGSTHSVATSLIEFILAHETQTLFIITSNSVMSRENNIDGKRLKPCAEHWMRVIEEIAKTSDWTELKPNHNSDTLELHSIHYLSATKEWT